MPAPAHWNFGEVGGVTSTSPPNQNMVIIPRMVVCKECLALLPDEYTPCEMHYSWHRRIENSIQEARDHYTPPPLIGGPRVSTTPDNSLFPEEPTS